MAAWVWIWIWILVYCVMSPIGAHFNTSHDKAHCALTVKPQSGLGSDAISEGAGSRVPGSLAPSLAAPRG
jgi:hypothetical protein